MKAKVVNIREVTQEQAKVFAQDEISSMESWKLIEVELDKGKSFIGLVHPHDKGYFDMHLASAGIPREPSIRYFLSRSEDYLNKK